MSPSVSFLGTVPWTTFFNLSSVHHVCTPPRTPRTTGGVLFFTTSVALAMSATCSPSPLGPGGGTGATAVSTGFVTAVLTDLKSSGTSEAISSTACEMSPLEAKESTTFFTGLPVCGLRICFLKSGVEGSCGFETRGGAGAGAVTNDQMVGLAGKRRMTNSVGLASLYEARVGNPSQGQVKRSCKVVTTDWGCTFGP